MSGVWGNRLKLSIFGESHGEAIGIVIDGLPAGIEIDLDYISKEMKRRAPGRNKLSTPRQEKDEFNILSGYFNGRTTGTPLSCVIYNSNQKSKDYDKIKNIMRPSHADYTGYIRYGGFNDYRGGGHFSGRITAPFVFAGAIAKQILKKRGVVVGAHIQSIGDIQDRKFDPCNIDEKTLIDITNKEFPVIDDEMGLKMQEIILQARSQEDSVGGVIEAAAINLEAGLGSPFFHSVESRLSQLLFSIPAVKGVEFGEGFNITRMFGSQANDEFYVDNGKVKTRTNNNGGILGGITSGMPLIVRVAFKPTPSIAKEQQTIDISNMENISIKVEGRHDPCIVQRAVPVVESAIAICLLDFMLEKDGYVWMD